MFFRTLAARILFIVLVVVVSSLPAHALDITPYASVLDKFVTDDGRVNYAGLLAQRKQLDMFVQQLAAFPPNDYQALSEKAKLAFWLNAYNALILHTVIDNYPIRPRAVKAFLFPKNSIRQIANVLEGKFLMVMGKKMSFEDIENDVLRTEFKEPRFNFAISFGALGSAPLSNIPFSESQLEAQLRERTNIFLQRATTVVIDEDRKTVTVSGLFKMAGKDFLERYGGDKQFSYLAPTEGAVLNFLSKNAEPGTQRQINSQAFFLRYQDFDWTLNDQN